MITNQVLFSIFFLCSILILPSWNYKFETCCADEKTTNTTASLRLLSCPLNFIIKLRTVIFYTGSGCARSACQRRLNKHYLACNNHRTCSISIRCIHMDSSTCSWLAKDTIHSQYLIVDYDCILYEPEPPLIALNRLNNNNNKSRGNDNKNIVLFSAKINIESPPDIANDSISAITDDERGWKEFILKQYLNGKRPPLNFNEKPIIIHQQRSLFSDVLRTVIILIVFTFILIVLMLIGLFIYKRITNYHKRKFFGHHKEQQQKHEPFPGDEAYDNLKTSAAGSTTDSGAATDV
jgi:preprotein translocase subunit SecG